TATPPLATACQSLLEAAVEGAVKPRKLDGFTPSTAVNVPLILILAASIGSVPVTPDCLATAARTLPDSEKGATTSRSACFRPRSGATGARLAVGEAVLAGAVLAGAETRATGTVMGVPLASALPPSMGTTGPIVVDGAGLVRGIGWAAAAPTAAGLPPTVARTTPVAVPARTSALISTGSRRLGFAEDDGSRRQRRRTASARECIGPNITPHNTVPGGCLPSQGTPAPASGGGRAGQTGRDSTSVSSAGVVTGAWQVNWRQTYAAGAPSTRPRPSSSGMADEVLSPRARTAPGGAACRAVWCSTRVRSSSGPPTTAISAGPLSQASATARPMPAARG